MAKPAQTNWIRLQRYDPIACWVTVRRAGKTLEDATACMQEYQSLNPTERYRLAALDKHGTLVPLPDSAPAKE